MGRSARWLKYLKRISVFIALLFLKSPAFRVLFVSNIELAFHISGVCVANSTNCRSKIFEQKYSRKFLKVCHPLTSALNSHEGRD